MNECDEIVNYNSSIFWEDIPSRDNSKSVFVRFSLFSTHVFHQII